MFDENEDLGVPKSNMSEFIQDLRGRLTLLTDLVDYESLGLSLKQIRKPYFVVGLPGIGKTCGIQNVIKEINEELPEGKKLGFKKILLGQTVVGSLTGIPVVKQDGTVVRVQMPDLPDAERDGEYGVLFLDELTTSDEMQMQPALALCDDSRCIGEYTLPEHWIVVAAGNGPDCTNFVRTDDAMISRFVVFDINYDFKKDWRPYALATDINSDIIAFLDFDNTACVRVESNEMNKAGKAFPCPRTWERLSDELKIRKALGNPVPQNKLANFAGRIVGIKAGREFEAFCQFRQTLQFSADKILAGKEVKPGEIQQEVFHIILQDCVKAAKKLLDSTTTGGGDYPLSTYKAVANMVDWFLCLESAEMKLNSVVEMRNDIPALGLMLSEDDFVDLCPTYDNFLGEYSDMILEVL